MSLIVILLMIIFGVGALVFLRKDPLQVSWARPAAGVCAAIALALALGRMLQPDGSDMEATLAAHEHYQQICGEYLAQDLTQRHPGARVTILTAPDMPAASSVVGTRTLTESLRQALELGGAKVTVRQVEIPGEEKALYLEETGQDIGTPEAQATMEEMMIMEGSMWFDGAQLAKLLVELQDEADLVVSTLELGMGSVDNSLPPSGQSPKLVLVNGWVENVSDLLEQTSLDAVVLHRNNPEAWKSRLEIPSDAGEAFNQRFLLVTPDNVASLAGQHPSL